MRSHPGLFITLEGGDGVGKSTQAALLDSWLTDSGHTVVRTREPGATELGAMIRNLLLHTETEIDAKAEALLYAADRAQHITEVVRPALERGDIVVQDRYIDSSLAYQGAGRVLSADDVRHVSEWATDGLWPDLTILLDLSVEAAALRMDARSTRDRLEREQIEFHQAVREGFLRIAASAPERTLVLDAALAPEMLAEQIRERVATLLG